MNSKRPEITPIIDQLADELDEAHIGAGEQMKPVEPSDEERRNGWTTETLTDYLASRTAGQSLSIDVNSLQRRMARRPSLQNNAYNPHRWRE